MAKNISIQKKIDINLTLPNTTGWHVIIENEFTANVKDFVGIPNSTKESFCCHLTANMESSRFYYNILLKHTLPYLNEFCQINNLPYKLCLMDKEIHISKDDKIYPLNNSLKWLKNMIHDILDNIIKSHICKKTHLLSESGVIDINSIKGIVLIENICAYLPANMQANIGFWLTDSFPNTQFIVTTHSPLICRACEKGTIWLISESNNIREVLGSEKDKLIYGNILDAYSTEIFGQSAVRSEKSKEMLNRLCRLNMLAAFGKISEIEDSERMQLQRIFQTDVTTY